LAGAPLAGCARDGHINSLRNLDLRRTDARRAPILAIMPAAIAATLPPRCRCLPTFPSPTEAVSVRNAAPVQPPPRQRRNTVKCAGDCAEYWPQRYSRSDSCGLAERAATTCMLLASPTRRLHSFALSCTHLPYIVQVSGYSTGVRLTKRPGSRRRWSLMHRQDKRE
jgi:hypothetical protein